MRLAVLAALLLLLLLPEAVSQKRRKQRSAPPPREAAAAADSAASSAAESGSDSGSPFVNERGGLDLAILLEEYGGTSDFFGSAWSIAPVVLRARVLEGDPTVPERLHLDWLATETLLSVKSEPPPPPISPHEVCQDISCSTAFRSALESAIVPAEPRLRPAAAVHFAASDSRDLHSAICLGYTLHCHGVEQLWAPVNQFLRSLIASTQLLWKASLHVLPNDEGWEAGVGFVDGMRHSLLLQVEGISSFAVTPQRDGATGEPLTHTLLPGHALYVPQGWVATSAESEEASAAGPSLLLSVVTAAEHLNHGSFIDYMLKAWAMMTADGRQVHATTTIEKLSEEGKLRSWLKDKREDVSEPAGALLRRSLPPKAAGVFSTAEIRETVVDVMTTSGADAERCGEEDCASILRGLVEVEEATFVALCNHIHGSVVAKTVDAVLSALEEREAKISWAVAAVGEKEDWLLRKHVEWEASLVDTDNDDDDDDGRDGEDEEFVALSLTDPEGDKTVRYFKKELEGTLEYLLGEKSPDELQGTGWFPRANVPGNSFTTLSLLSQLAQLGVIELGVTADMGLVQERGSEEEEQEQEDEDDEDDKDAADAATKSEL